MARNKTATTGAITLHIASDVNQVEITNRGSHPVYLGPRRGYPMRVCAPGASVKVPTDYLAWTLTGNSDISIVEGDF